MSAVETTSVYIYIYIIRLLTVLLQCAFNLGVTSWPKSEQDHQHCTYKKSNQIVTVYKATMVESPNTRVIQPLIPGCCAFGEVNVVVMETCGIQNKGRHRSRQKRV